MLYNECLVIVDALRVNELGLVMIRLHTFAEANEWIELDGMGCHTIFG